MEQQYLSILKTLITAFRDRDRHITLKTTGTAGEFSRKVNFHELKASGSVFAAALQNNTSTDDLQAMADNFSREGCLSTNPHAASALQSIHLLHALPSSQHCPILAQRRKPPEPLRL
jgi:hypothetical protein